jgi:hypothetical protein
LLETGYSLLSSSGSISLATANAGSTGVSGNVVLSTGTSSFGNLGCMLLETGQTTAGHAGTIDFSVGEGDSGEGGHITVTAGHHTRTHRWFRVTGFWREHRNVEW